MPGASQHAHRLVDNAHGLIDNAHGLINNAHGISNNAHGISNDSQFREVEHDLLLSVVLELDRCDRIVG